jgi:hypothetical protein
LIPEFGLVGAALATTVAILLRNVLRLGLLYRIGRIHALRRSIYGPLALTTAVTGGLSLVAGQASWWMLVGLLAVIGAVFLGSFPLTDSLSREDDVLVSRAGAAIQRMTPGTGAHRD